MLIEARGLHPGVTARALSLTLGPWLIRRLTARQIGQTIRPDGPQRHLAKAGTPTMGATLILFPLIVATLLLSDLTNPYVWLVVAVTAAYGVIGFTDDYRKLRRGHGRGLSGRAKLVGQTVVAAVAAAVLCRLEGFSTELYFPFFKDLHPDLGWAYVPFAALVMVGASNAVNLTDGLDGLPIGPVMTSALTYGVFAYVTGHVKLAEYLQIPYVPGVGELPIFVSLMNLLRRSGVLHGVRSISARVCTQQHSVANPAACRKCVRRPGSARGTLGPGRRTRTGHGQTGPGGVDSALCAPLRGAAP